MQTVFSIAAYAQPITTKIAGCFAFIDDDDDNAFGYGGEFSRNDKNLPIETATGEPNQIRRRDRSTNPQQLDLFSFYFTTLPP